MQATFYSFSKRSNSTKQPIDGTGTTLDIKLKNDCSYENPIFQLTNYNGNWNYFDWNNHFYFIDDVIYINNDIVEVHGSMDALATHKSEIGSTTASILYAGDSTKNNIIDKRIPITSDLTVGETQSALSGITILGPEGVGAKIIGITGKGSFGSYLMQNSNLMSEILDGVDDFIGTAVEPIDVLKQMFYGGSASESLKSAIEIPLVVPAGSVSSGNPEWLHLGNYPCVYNGQPLMGYKITTPVMISVTNITIPWNYTDWRRHAPYSEVILYLPLIGMFALSTDDLTSESSLDIQYAFNVTSGDIAVQVKAHSQGRIIGTASGNIALNTAFGSTGVDTTKITQAVAGGLISIGQSALGTGSPATLLGGLGNAALSTIGALQGNSSGSGGLGGGATHGLDKVIHCYVISRTLTDSPSNLASVIGKPYFAKDVVGNHNGFIMTEGFSVQGRMNENERTKINSMLDSGIFYE